MYLVQVQMNGIAIEDMHVSSKALEERAIRCDESWPGQLCRDEGMGRAGSQVPGRTDRADFTDPMQQQYTHGAQHGLRPI